MPIIGAWRAKLELSSSMVLDGAVVLTVDGISFTGTAMPNRSGLSGSRSRAMVVGGAGGLSTVLPAKNYANGVSVRTVVGDILRECGESLSSASDEGILGSVLPKWERVRGAASRALVGILDEVGGIWRIERSGAVLVTVEAYPETDVEHELLDEDWAAGRILIRPKAPDLLPGVTFSGQEIRFVRHMIDGGGMRTEAYLQSPSGLAERFLTGIRRKIDYATLWPARVVRQNSDETLEVVPDDERLRQGRGGINKVPIRHGIPGVQSILVSSGTRVRIGFDGGDPDKPFAALWDSGSADLVQLGPLGAGVAYEGSAVEVYLPPAVPVSGTVGVLPFVGVMTIVTPAIGTVLIGSQTVKV
jgi:hypothetical protein